MKKLSLILIAIIFISSSLFFGINYFKERKAVNESIRVTKSIQREAAPIQPKEANKVKNLNWKEIKKKYPKVIAWIMIPDTKINYPIMQGSDNEEYLYLNYLGEYDKLGSIFIDYRQNNDFSNYNTQLYGHNINLNVEESKFGELNKYYDDTFFKEHNLLYIYTPEKIYFGEIFAIHTDSYDTKSNNIKIDSQVDLIEYAKFMQDKSEIKSDFNVSEIKKMLTLWTCSNKKEINSNGEYIELKESRTFVSVSLS